MFRKPLLPPAFLFKYSAPCFYREKLWTSGGVELEDSLPLLGQLEGKKPYADLRVAWNEEGLAFNLRVEGKKQPPWCRDSRSRTATACSSGSTPATRRTSTAPAASATALLYCPSVPAATFSGFMRLLAINRAGETPREIDTRGLKIKADTRAEALMWVWRHRYIELGRARGRATTC